MRSTSCLNFFHASGRFGESQSIEGLGSEEAIFLLSDEEIETCTGYFSAVDNLINNSSVQLQARQEKIQCCLNCLAECAM